MKLFKWIFSLLVNTALGAISLILLNTFGGRLAINPFTVIVTGLLGLPGVLLLLLLKIFL